MALAIVMDHTNLRITSERSKMCVCGKDASYEGKQGNNIQKSVCVQVTNSKTDNRQNGNSSQATQES